MDTSPTTTTEAPPASDSRSTLLSALDQGFALKSAGKLTVDDPMPESMADTPPSEEPAPAVSSTPPSRVAPPPSQATLQQQPASQQTRPPKPPPPATPEAKRTATAQQWKEVNEDRAALRAKVAEFEAEKTKWQQERTALDELPKIKTRADELDKILRQVAAERHPDLIGPIQQRQQTALALAKSVVPSEQADLVAGLLLQPDSEARTDALSEIVDSLKSVKRGRLEKAINEFDSAVADRNQLAAKSQEVYAQRQQQIAQQHAANVAQFDTELADWTNPANGLEMLIDKPADPAHTERRNRILSNARALFNGEVTDVREIARAALWSAWGQDLARQNLAQAAELKRLNDEVTRLKSGGPGLEGSTTADTSATDADSTSKPATMSTAEWIAQVAKREGVSFGNARY